MSRSPVAPKATTGVLQAMDSVAVCPNASASLFVAAKINHFERLPQGKIESGKRAERMINQMEQEGFGSCSNHRHCETVCPKEISVSNIAAMNKIL